MMRKSALFIAVCLVLSLPALAQGNSLQCTVSLSSSTVAVLMPVTASGSCSDSQNVILTETLNWGDGSVPAAVSQSFQAQHSYSAVGTYTVTLSATDSAGNIASASQTLNITPNQPPNCTLTSVSPTSGAAPLPVTASGSCTDPEGDVTSTTINWGDGTTSTGSSGSHTYAATGNFPVTLSATDAAGNNASSAPVNVNVTNNKPPSCSLSITPDKGSAPLSVTANASCNDPENDIISEALNWGDGTTTPVSSTTQTYTHTYATAGTFAAVLSATDSANNTGTAQKTVRVTAGAAGPTCALAVAPSSGQVPLSVAATASCNDSAASITREQLSWGDGATTPVSGTTTTYPHTYLTSGSFTVLLTATDSAGNSGSAAQTVTATGGPVNSTPACTVTATPASGSAPLTVSVTAACSDPQNDLASIITSFGDGWYLAGSNPVHTYVNGGSYTLTVIATDKSGKSSGPVSQTITVSNNSPLFVGISNGQIAQFTKSGTSQNTLNSNRGGSITGMAFDAAENLYTSDFTANTVTRFSGNGGLLGAFGSGYNCKPESIVFDRTGNAYVGETGCSHALLKLDGYGNLEASYSVATEKQGSDWIDLAPDQCTIYYTSQGSSVLRFNACTGQQMAPFATGLNTGLAVKILSNGDLLVADKQDIVRFDSAGRKIMTYTASGESCFVGLALDSDGASFWATDYCSSDVVQFDINSGNELSKFNSGTATNTVYGIAERVAPPKLAPAGPLMPSPAQASIAGGQSASFNLNFTPNGAAAGQTFTLSCANLPANASCAFSPATLIAGSNTVTAQMTITTAGATAELTRPARFWNWTLAMALPWLGLAFCLPDPRRRRKRFLLTLALLACLLALLSCSGASGNSSSSPNNPAVAPTAGTATPAGAYTVVVHATSAAGIQSSTAVTLNVQ